MKKVLFMLAAIALASATQAASMKWGTGTVTLPGSSTKITASNVNYFFYAEELADPWGTKSSSTGEGSAITYSLAASDSFTKTVSKGVATITDSATYSSGDTAYGAVILWYDADSSGTINVGDYYMTGTGSYAFEADSTKTSNLTMNSWTEITAPTPTPDPSGVPEPTSGLLMLVGLGALALRRRR